ncbi:MAG: penicillin-binding protein 1C [Pigmentiphaga sp.]|nr:penicillin-binding protein 1C [Pigmentiphaga sp.]
MGRSPHERRHAWRRALAGVLVSGLLLAAIALWLDHRYPLPPLEPPPSPAVVDRHGVLLRQWPAADGAWRRPVALDAIAPEYLDALIAYEDRAFWWHPGVNAYALGRAAWQWLRQGRIVSGGSTLTMQLARLVDPALQQDTRRVATKLRQILRALQLEWHHDKRTLLRLYVNRVPMGGRWEGVAAGSEHWLGKPPGQLTFAEAALLAALPRAPSLTRPDRFPEAAREARDRVLERLVRTGRLTAAEAADARLEAILPPPPARPRRAPLAAELARRLQPDEAVVSTTLDTAIQATIERLVRQRLWQLPADASAAVLVLDSTDLSVLAYAGSADYGSEARSGYLDMVHAWRSPGSALKPFLYALALDRGLIHSQSLLVDAPQSFDGYRPGNFQASFQGPVAAAEALARSLNVPAVDLLDRLGPASVDAAWNHAGLRLRYPAGAAPNLSLILGGVATTLWDLAGAYRALGAAGMAGTPRLLSGEPPRERRLMSPGAAYIVRDMLERGLPGRPQPRGMAWKTGTSFGFRDAWAAGVADDYTLAVWVGRPDGTPNPGHVGATSAAPLWQDIARNLPRRHRAAPRPSGVESAIICWPLGLREQALPAAQCAERRRAWLLAGTAPPTLPDRSGQPLLMPAWVREEAAVRVRPGCAAFTDDVKAGAITRWPQALAPWVVELETGPWSGLPWAPGCAPPPPASRLALHGVVDDGWLQAAPGANGVRLSLEVTGGTAPYRWWLDGRQLAATAARSVLEVRQPGRHRLAVMDADGRHQAATFTLAAPPAMPYRIKSHRSATAARCPPPGSVCRAWPRRP